MSLDGPTVITHSDYRQVLRHQTMVLLGPSPPLSREELDFIGAYEQRRSERGWHQPGEMPALAPLYELDAEPSAEDTTILQSLMSVGSSQERLEFLG